MIFRIGGLFLAASIACAGTAAAASSLPDECVTKAASRYQMPAAMIRLAHAAEDIRFGEGSCVTFKGAPSTLCGPMKMEISIWGPAIARRDGISSEEAKAKLASDACANVDAFAWAWRVNMDGDAKGEAWTALMQTRSRSAHEQRKYFEELAKAGQSLPADWQAVKPLIRPTGRQ